MERDGAVAWLGVVIASAGTAAAAWLILLPGSRWAGVAAACATVGLAMSGIASSAIARFAATVAYRAFDGLILSSMAWAWRAEDPGASAAALLSLAGGFMASYLSDRGRSLGYDIASSGINLFLRCALVSTALSTGRPAFWLWLLAGLSILTAIVRAGQAFKEERAS